MSDFIIELDDDKVYTTGDTVSGRVCFNVKERLDLNSIDVTFLGQSKSRNAVHAGQGYVTKLEKHTLIEARTVVFPPPDILSLRSSDTLTITEGSYTYPFGFVIPDKRHKAKCQVDMSFFHSRGYPKKEPRDEVSLAPTYENKVAIDNYCRVQYTIVAAIRSPSKFKFDTKVTKEIKFYPCNDDMTYLLNYLLEGGAPLQDADAAVKELRYLDNGSMEVDSFFRKMFVSDGIRVPMELGVSFIGPPLITAIGDTRRAIQSGCKLSQFVRVSLQTPMSSLSWRDIVGLGTLQKGDEIKDSCKVRLSSLKIKLVLHIRYFAVKTSRRKTKYTLVDKALDNEIELSSFERIPVDETRQKSKKSEMYKFELDPSWYDCEITDVGQSFMTCNIKRNFSLQVSVGIASTQDITKEVVFKSESPIILQKCGGLENGEGDRPPGYGNPPPMYGDESKSEPIEWSI